MWKKIVKPEYATQKQLRIFIAELCVSFIKAMDGGGGTHYCGLRESGYGSEQDYTYTLIDCEYEMPEITVAILAERLGTHAGGTEEYERCLIAGANELSCANGTRIVPLISHRHAIRLLPEQVRSRCRFLWPGGKIGTMLAGGAVRDIKPDVLHSCFVMPPVPAGLPVITTVHDVGFIRYPNHYSRALCLRLKLMLNRIVDRSDLIVTVSNYTRKELLELTGIQEHRVVTVYNGLNSVFLESKSGVDDLAVFKTYGLCKPYILYTGRLQPRKNIIPLVEAYEILRATKRFGGQLALVGANRTFLWKEIQRRIDASPYRADIIQAGHVPHGDLSMFYHNAIVYAFVSLYEGFGLPILEAMACSLPVVCSRATSLPEVAGGAALLVDPNSPAEIADALEKAISNETIRCDLIKRGLVRAGQFSWNSTAVKMVELYKKVAS